MLKKTQPQVTPRRGPFGVMTRTRESAETHFVLGWPRYRPFRTEDGDMSNPPMLDLPMCAATDQQYGVITIESEGQAFRMVECTGCLRALDAQLNRSADEAARPKRHRSRRVRVPAST